MNCIQTYKEASGGLCLGKGVPIDAVVLQSQLLGFFFLFFFFSLRDFLLEKGEASGSSIQGMSHR